ncbi:MAG: protein translocase subunit SecF [Acidobacteria bacterium]|nr:protein translocase subunit SecF [Acidobacteriota bacterium]
MRLVGKTEIDFLGNRGIAAAVSGALILASIASIVLHGGLRYGIDFSGGSQVIVLFAERPDLDLLRATLAAEGIEDLTIQEFVAQPGREEVLIRTPLTDADDAGLLGEIYSALRVFDSTQAGAGQELDFNTVSREVVSSRLLELNPLEFDIVVDLDDARAEYDRVADLGLGARDRVGLLSSWDAVEATDIDPRILSWMKDTFYFGGHAVVGQDFVGPQVGGELRLQTAYVMFWALLGLLAYITYRFEFRFGVGAVAALVHDVVIAVGAFSIANREFNLPVVAAFLTIIGYSLNDTVVVFDRIRENGQTQRRMPLADRINLSINQTLSRTVLTSGTTLMVVLSLFFYGGPVINNFAFALLVGVIVGTYSSIFVASPVYFELAKRALAKKK